MESHLQTRWVYPLFLLCLVGAGFCKPNAVCESKDPVCETRECKESANDLLQNMDQTVDPCEDFEKFACGTYHKNRKIPDDKPIISSFTPVKEVLMERARILLEAEDSEEDFESEQKARVYYRSCTNVDKLEELGVQPMQQHLADLGGWPVLEGEQWKGEESFTWYDQNIRLSELGEASSRVYIVSLSVTMDSKNNSWRALHLDQPSLGLSREYLVKGSDDKDVKNYLKYMVDAAVLLGADMKQAEEDMAKVLRFEMALANISIPREERRDSEKLYNPFTLKKLQVGGGLPPSWTEYVHGLVKPYQDIKNSLDITENEKVIVQAPTYIEKLGPIIEEFDARTVANYMGWRVVRSHMSHMNLAARNIKHEYDKLTEGVKTPLPTWKRCAHDVGFDDFNKYKLHIPASSMYVKKYFKPEDKEVMSEMVFFIRKAFSKMIKGLDWMNRRTKRQAKKKLRKMGQTLAYPDEILDKNSVDGLFVGLDFNEATYLENVLALSKHWTRWYYNRLRQKIDPTHWIEHQSVALVNAIYNEEINSMEFPAGILHGLFFNPRRPMYLNFGAIGMVIGHEITHGFDDQGRQRNYKGELKDWWSKKVAKAYKDRAQCIIDQYSNFTYNGMNLNGINCQGENIADNGGVKEAHLGYGLWVKKRGKEPRLPGFCYTPNQMYWISNGQVWCAKYTDELAKDQIQTGYHSLTPFRILGPLQNSKEFAKDFNCPVGSRMNPEKKCAVW